MLPGSLTRRLLQLGLLALVLALLVLPGQTAVAAVTVTPVLQEPDDVPTISAIWGPGVQQWAFHIGVLA
ncbi:MAG: hypothetical protein KA362_15990, partial [Chloroflexi bacterium]|nr:hypothetical protein [Chloroflexota bacterium]